MKKVNLLINPELLKARIERQKEILAQNPSLEPKEAFKMACKECAEKLEQNQQNG